MAILTIAIFIQYFLLLLFLLNKHFTKKRQIVKYLIPFGIYIVFIFTIIKDAYISYKELDNK